MNEQGEVLQNSPAFTLLTPTEYVNYLCMVAKEAKTIGIQNVAFTNNDINLLLANSLAGVNKYAVRLDGRARLEDELHGKIPPNIINISYVNDINSFMGKLTFPFGRNHIKGCYVSGENFIHAGIGGVNLGPKEWYNRHDYMLLTKNSELASVLAGFIFANANLTNCQYAFTKDIEVWFDGGRGNNESLIYNNICSLVKQAQPGSKIIASSPWMPGLRLNRALINAIKRGVNVTYATNLQIPTMPKELIYNGPKWAVTKLNRGLQATSITTEIHGKFLLFLNGTESYLVVTGHCLTDLQNFAGTQEVALLLKNNQIPLGFDTYVSNLLSDTN